MFILKYSLILVLTLGCVYHVAAQPTFSSNDIPQIGDSFIVRSYSSGITSPVTSPGLSGSNVTWDFSTLTVTSSTTAYVVSPTDAPYISDFSGIDEVIADSSSGFYGYSYYHKDGNTLRALDEVIATSTTGLISESTLPTPDLDFVPINYLNTLTSTSTTPLKLIFTGTSTGISVQHTTWYADAYGTLILPYVTYPNALRVKVNLFIRDSSQTSTFPTEYTIQLITLSMYRWHVPGQRSSPVFFILNEISTTTTISYSPTGTVTSSPNILTLNSCASYQHATSVPTDIISQPNTVNPTYIYPNPATDLLFYNDSMGNLSSVKIMGIDGTCIKEIKDIGSSKIDIADLKSGLYILEVQSEQGTWRQKVQKL